MGRNIDLDAVGRNFSFGEEEAYDYFFRLYFRALCLFARRILQGQCEPEDIVQECFVKLWQKRTSINSSAAIKTYLYKTVQNACLDFIKSKQAKLKIVSISEDLLTENPFQNTEAAIIEAELVRQIHLLAENLPQRIQAVFKLYYFEGRSENEIGELMQTSIHTVKNQRIRALALIKSRFNPAKNA